MITVYGLKVSYFTGKLEGYLRCKEIPYRFQAMTAKDFVKRIPEKTGAMQMPAVELPDGRWMTDTSPIIDWFENEYGGRPILPPDPAQAFLCRVIEDYADEWLWRPAMHFRWSYPASAKLLARQIADEMGREIRLPGFLKRLQVERRQRFNFVARDGVTDHTRANVESAYFTLLKMLSDVFSSRPYVFGDLPTLADIGLFGPLFRHFSMDPAPAVIMRESAPAVFEWVYRLWNAKLERINGEITPDIPSDLAPLLREIAETHLTALNANARAFAAGEKFYGADIQGALYERLPVSQYRVWCLEKLLDWRRALNEETRAAIDALLTGRDGVAPMLEAPQVASGYDRGGHAPFGRSIPVFADVKG